MAQLRRLFSSLYSPPRDPRFSVLIDKDLEFFTSLLPPTSIQTQDLEPYNQDWIGVFKGNSKLVLKPTLTEQLQAIINYCRQRKLAICPQGGNTGLVGGSVPVYDEIVVNLNKMNKILEFDDSQGIVRAESGVILEVLNNYVKEKGYIVPLDLGAKGSCHIGGNIATNAGGLRLLRYGSLHGSVLGLEAVTGNGDVLNTLHSMRKDNTGFDLKQLFIGSEGALGIVTKVAIQLAPKPTSVQLAFLAVNTFSEVLEIYKKTRNGLGEILSAFEFMDVESLDLVLKNVPNTRYPLSAKHRFYVLIETSGSNSDHDVQKLEHLLEDITQNLAKDGVIAQDERQAQEIWKLRESCADANIKEGYCFKYDVSLPHDSFYRLVEEVRTRVGSLGNTTGYGHIGDSNIHINVTVPQNDNIDTVKAVLEPFIYEYLHSVKGSISAEHGIGLMKPNKLHYSKSTEMIDYMQRIKKMFDPEGIMNPYKVIPN